MQLNPVSCERQIRSIHGRSDYEKVKNLLILHGAQDLSNLGGVTANQLTHILGVIEHLSDKFKETCLSKITNSLKDRLNHIKYLNTLFGFFSYLFQQKTRDELNSERLQLQQFLDQIEASLKTAKEKTRCEKIELEKKQALYEEQSFAEISTLFDEKTLPSVKEFEKIIIKPKNEKNQVNPSEEVQAPPKQVQVVPSPTIIPIKKRFVPPRSPATNSPTTADKPPLNQKPVSKTSENSSSNIPIAPPLAPPPPILLGPGGIPIPPPLAPPGAPVISPDSNGIQIQLKGEPPIPKGVGLSAQRIKAFVNLNNVNRQILTDYKDNLKKLLEPYNQEITNRDMEVAGFKDEQSQRTNDIKSLNEKINKLERLKKEIQEKMNNKEIFIFSQITTGIGEKVNIPLFSDPKEYEGCKEAASYSVSKFLNSITLRIVSDTQNIEKLKQKLNNEIDKKKYKDLEEGGVKSTVDAAFTLAELVPLIKKKNDLIALIERGLKAKPDIKQQGTKSTSSEVSPKTQLIDGLKSHFAFMSRRAGGGGNEDSPINKAFRALQRQLGAVEDETEITAHCDLMDQWLKSETNKK